MEGVAVRLQLQGRRCLVVGGGAVATRRVRTLLGSGARVTVVAPRIDEALTRLAAQDAVELAGLEILERPFDATDLSTDRSADGEVGDLPVLVVVATDDPAVNDRVGALARAAGVLVNRADDAPLGEVTFPAVVTRGPVAIAVSSGEPTASRWVADQLEEHLDQLLGLDGTGLDRLVQVLSEVRRELRRGGAPEGASAGADERGVTVGPVDWRSALDGSILELIHQGRTAEAKERLLACLSS